MSGDPGPKDDPILFYAEEMTVSKLILLKHKGVKFELYYKVKEKIMKEKDPVNNYFDCVSSCDTDNKECHNECTEELKENDKAD